MSFCDSAARIQVGKKAIFNEQAGDILTQYNAGLMDFFQGVLFFNADSFLPRR